jgi:two-component system sensor histidine kinase TctE
MRRLSSHLLGWVLWPTLLLSAIAIPIGHQRGLAKANEAYDRTLLGSAMAIAERLHFADGRVRVDVPYAALEMLETGSHDRIFYRVDSLEDRGFVSGYEDLPAPPARLQVDEPVFHDALYRGERLRLVSMLKRVYDPQVHGPVLVQVGETLGARERLSQRILRDAVLTQLGLIAAAIVLVTLGIRRGLLPLKGLRREVLARSGDDLSPIDTHDVPREVVPLVDALNQHSARQRALTEAQRRFFANASHQLKTPLAVLNAQAALALRQQDRAEVQATLREMQACTRAAGRIVQQLLALARSDPGQPMERSAVDLAAMCRELLLELMPLARSRRIDLGLEDAPETIVTGERTLLHEMLANLVHNALTYTPEGGTVTVSLGREESAGGSLHTLVVEDDGPGIPAAERARVFERFYRLGGGTEGSGLGLAIVHDVCLRHGMSVALEDGCGGRAGSGPGLRVVLRWPA